MPRSRRIQLPGGVYHIITRGHERKNIFIDRRDRCEFLERLGRALERSGCQCFAWVLMSNHVHLLIRNGEEAVSNFMRRLLTGYAIYFNRRHGRSGYLFQNRFKSILCQESAYFLELIRYIHLNPLRARIVGTMLELDQYPWSGHAVILGNQAHPWQEVSYVLEKFGSTRSSAVRLYRDFISEGLTKRLAVDLSGGGLMRSAGGWENVERLKRKGERWRGDERILGDGDFVENALTAVEQKLTQTEKMKREGWNLEMLANQVCKHFSIDPGLIVRKGRNNALQKARDAVAYIGVNVLCLARKELMSFLRVSQPGLSKAIKRGEGAANLAALKLLS